MDYIALGAFIGKSCFGGTLPRGAYPYLSMAQLAMANFGGNIFSIKI